MTTAIYTFNGAKVRTLGTPEAPLFVAADVCQCLGLPNHSQAVSTLDESEKGVTISDTLGGKQQVSVVNESGLYSLIFKSRKAQAKEFQRWVTSEVLPAIRKTGSYKTSRQPNEGMARLLELAQQLQGEQAMRVLKLIAPSNEYGSLSNSSGLPRTRLMPAYYTSRWPRDSRTQAMLEIESNQLIIESILLEAGRQLEG